MAEAVAALPKPSTAAEGHFVPVLTICVVILIAWYIAAIPMNWVVTVAQDRGGGRRDVGMCSPSRGTRRGPVIPAPHQIVIELWNSVFMVKPWMPKSLVYHGWVTLSSTLVGFVLGSLLGIVLAIAIVHSTILSKSLMPWIIASQAIPILAIAPMVIVVLGSLGFTGLVPKSLISMYLCFFPVTIGMVKGLTSPDPMQLDLMRTYNSSTNQVLWKLRFPVLGAVPVHVAEGGGGDCLDRRHRGRVADGGCRRHRRAAAAGLLLRADRADLGGAVHGVLHRGGACVARRDLPSASR